MKTTITIQNLKCGGCANTITTKVSALENISDVKVDVETSTVSFTYKTAIDLNSANEKLASLGYPAEGDKNTIVSKAKSFVSCTSGRISN